MKLVELAKLVALCCGVTATAVLGQSPGDFAAPEVGQPIDDGAYSLPFHGDVRCDDGCDAWPGGCTSCNASGGRMLADRFAGLCGCDRQLGEPFQVFGQCNDFRIAGWSQLGYHDQNLILFNSRKNNLQWQQAWLYAQKELDTACGYDWGGRVDYLYGTDAPDTQAFGIDNDHWDNGWDNGADYGHALPQLYLEAGYGDLTVKAGKFFTLVGYEVVAAPENFFYSHAYTMYNSEPFTHTGALATLSCGDGMELYGGYVLGWDSGFEDNGDAFLGGSSYNLTEDIRVTSIYVLGRFADNLSAVEKGYMQSTVAQVQLNDRLVYIFQNDWLKTKDGNEDRARKTVGLNQYLIQTISDSLSVGARMEWWNVNGDSRAYYGDLAPPNFVIDGDFNIYAVTLGVNYKPCANVVVRPEIRWDWAFGDRDALGSTGVDILEGNDSQQTTFGVDAILLF